MNRAQNTGQKTSLNRRILQNVDASKKGAILEWVTTRTRRRGEECHRHFRCKLRLWICDRARSVIESLSRVGIKRSAMERSTLAGKSSPCISSFLRIDDGRRRRGRRRWRRRRRGAAMGWQIIFRGAKTLSEPADPGWHLNIQGSGTRIRRDRDITATIFIKLPRIRAPIYFRHTVRRGRE